MSTELAINAYLIERVRDLERTILELRVTIAKQREFLERYREGYEEQLEEAQAYFELDES